jgi:hypothetical protein
MQNIEYNHEDFEQTAQSKQDEGLLVKFFMKRKPTTGNMAEYVDIRIPGTRSGGYCGPARVDHVSRFPRHYAAFKNRMEMPSDGTPLIDWPMIGTDRAQELTFHNIKTVEQLASVSDTHSSKFMGMESLKRQAKEWLEDEVEKNKANELKAELAARDEKIAELEAKMEELLKAVKPKRAYKKRTPKVVTEDATD